jgi:hypothetical protein
VEVKIMTTITLTPEQGQTIEQANGQPVRVEDPRNHCTYVLVQEDAFERLAMGETRLAPCFDIPEDVRRSQEAFLRDLPGLLEDDSLRGKWIGYQGGERIGIAPSEETLIQECSKRGLKADQYEIFVIEETEEVDYPSSWLP